MMLAQLKLELLSSKPIAIQKAIEQCKNIKEYISQYHSKMKRYKMK